MSRQDYLHLLLRTTVLASIISVLGCAPSVSLGSHLVNGQFESIQDGFPNGWNLDNKVRGKGRIEMVVLDDHGHVLQLMPNKDNVGDDALGLGQLLDAQQFRGKTLNATALIGAEGASTAIVGVHAIGGSGGDAYIQFTQADSQGQLVAKQDSFVVPDSATNIIVYAVVAGQSGHAMFDDITLSSTETARTSAPDTSVIEGGVTIDVRSVVRRVPETLFGTNIEWINNGQGIWSVEQNRLHPDVVKLTREMGVTLLRFPGGVFSDYYNWRDGVGPRLQRPVRRHYPKGPESYNVFGTDEALELASRTRSKLLITVNAGHGDAAQAADWVRYVNEKDDVVWWEVGNELYMDGDLSGAEMSAAEYANKAAGFISAMRSADPDIKLGAIGGINYGRYSFVKSADWNRQVLSRIGKDIDFFAVHNAYAPVLIGASANIDGRDVYQTLLAAPVNIDANLTALANQLERYESKSRPISIAITEWGPFFHVAPDSPWVDHVKTLGSSLFVGSTLHTLMRHPKVEVANAFKLTDLGFMGWIGNVGSDFQVTAPYHAFRMYTPTIGGEVVSADVTIATYNSRSLGVVDGVRNVPYVDVLAVRNRDDETLMIYLINRHLDAPVAMTVNVQGMADFGEVTRTVLQGSAIDAHTGTHPPRIPGLTWAKQVNVERFDRGAPGEVQLTTERDTRPKEDQQRQMLPPRSITRLVVSAVDYE
ncbi:MAG: alpha-L-arabinofuranosidase C-terminal domain-containing protein [Pseudomonadota bacterium]